MNGDCAGNGNGKCSLIRERANTHTYTHGVANESSKDITWRWIEIIRSKSVSEYGKEEVKTALKPVNLLSAVSFEF